MTRAMQPAALSPPPTRHFLSEGRTLLEFGLSTIMMPVLMQAPRGDRHPVMVLPGFLAGDLSTKPLRTFLKLKGYRAQGWGLGQNLGTEIIGGDQVLSDSLIDRLLTLALTHEQKVSLVGWSLGGILARELARMLPDYVRQVITLGSPFNGINGTSKFTTGLFEMINGDVARQTPEYLQRMLVPPPVPTTTIFSRTDGIAHWRACKDDDEALHSQSENIEVKGSHIGLGHNPQCIWIIADRLAQKEHQWRPFRHKTMHKVLYPNPARA